VNGELNSNVPKKEINIIENNKKTINKEIES
jgi:hypothetical protein